ncbi:MAG: hypothetical protein CL910_17995 [Deltaproteobacteria bacterium]|nr:hypothetical protein [Deltaproteobacteria bacterium]
MKALLVALLVATGAVAQSGGSPVVRIHDLAGLGPIGCEEPRLSLPFRVAGHEWEAAPDERPGLDERSLSDLVDWASRGLEIPVPPMEVLGTHLILQAPAVVHGRLERCLAALRRVATERFDIAVHVVPARALGATTRSVFDAEGVARVVAAHPPVRTLRTSATPGRIARLAALRRRSFVATWDVEVSGVAFPPHPWVQHISTGHEAWVAVHVAADGRLLLDVVARHARLPARPRDVDGGIQSGRVQYPATRSAAARGSAFIADGGGVLLGADRPDSAWLVTVRRRSRSSSILASGSDSELLPAGDVLRGMRWGFPDPWPPLPSGFARGLGLHSLGEGDDDPRRRRVDVAEMLRRAAGGNPGLDHLLFFGDHVLVHGPRGARVAAREVLWAMARATSRSVSLDVRHGVVEGSFARDPLMLAKRLPHVARSIAREGDELGVMVGGELAYQKDIDVEIDMAALYADPIDERLFTGFCLRGRPRVHRSGRVLLDGRVFWQELKALRTRTIEDSPLGPVELPDAIHVAHDDAWTLLPGRWTTLLSAPLPSTSDGTRRTFVCVVRARVR